VFETILGIPAHPLLIHAAVVFVPLLVAGSIIYALVPMTRRYIWWAVLGLGVVAPLAAWAAKLSGQALRARMIRRGTATPEFLPKIDQHMSYGNMTAYLTTGLGVLAIVMVLVLHARVRAAEGTGSTIGAAASGSALITVIFAVLTVALGAATGYYVFKTGDTGAHMVWGSL
jgi:hypothetical protein